MSGRVVFLSLLAVLLLGGCDKFKPASLVEGVRVLAIRADPAEVGSGEQAILHALVVDAVAGLDLGLDLGAPPITYEWALCTKRPKIGVDIDPDCFDADSADFLTPLPTLDDHGTMLTMPTLSIMSFNLPDSTGGFYVPVRLRITAGATTITAFHRLRWKAGFVPPNQNPTLTGISYVPTGADGELPDLGQTVDIQPLLDGVPLDLPIGGKLRLRASDAAGSAETYLTFVGAPTDLTQLMTKSVTEGVRFFWYASAGKLGPDVTGEARPDAMLDTKQYLDSLPASQDLVDLWLVAREERGGVDFLRRQIRLH